MTPVMALGDVDLGGMHLGGMHLGAIYLGERVTTIGRRLLVRLGLRGRVRVSVKARVFLRDRRWLGLAGRLTLP
jgi:hypothetical protein